MSAQAPVLTLGVALMVASCGVAPDEVAPDDIPATDIAPAEAGAVKAPMLEVQVGNGSTLRFYDFPGDRAVGVLELGAPGTPSVLRDPALADRTPAEIFHAVAAAGATMPALLRENHDLLAGEGRARSLDDALSGRPRGWLAAELGDIIVAPVVCDSATFNADHCTVDGTFPNASCNLNTAVSHTHQSPETLNYHAGICVRTGPVADRLRYFEKSVGGCGGAPVWTTIWDGSVNGGGGHLSWTYISPGGSTNVRFWEHKATATTGDLYQWGQKWKAAHCVL